MKEKIRILVDAHVFDGGYQGTRTFLKGIYNELLNYPDLEIHFTARNIERLRSEFPHPAAHFLQLKSSSRIRRLGKELPSLAKHGQFDFVHFQYIIPPLRTAGLIVTMHDVIFCEYPDQFSYSYRIRKKFLYRYAAQKADILTTVSNYSKSSIESHLGISDKPIVLTPNGVEEIFFEEYDKHVCRELVRRKFGVDHFLFYPSRIEPRKNHILLCRSFVALDLHKKGYHLVLAGEKTLKVPELNAFMNSLPPEVLKHIHFLGKVDQNDLMNLYRASTAMVYPSLAEGFGIPPLEAAAAGIPVLCANNSALADFDFFGENHVAANDDRTFIIQLEKFLNNLPGIKQLEHIKTIVKERYNWKHSARSLYNAVINQSEQIKLKNYDTVRSA